MDWEKQIVEQYGEEYVIRQLAEESAELCQASLKLVRAMRNETPVRQIDAQSRMLEEIADVDVMLQVVKRAVLNAEANERIASTFRKKFDRMVDRMIEREPLDSDGK